MKYLSIDIEATGLKEMDLIIEYAMVPVCTENSVINHDLSFHSYIKCPSFDELKPHLDDWVIKNNESLINKASNEGINIDNFKLKLEEYFDREPIRSFFNFPEEKICILGKSLNAIDLPFLNRDLGWDFMRKYFHHQVLDVSSIVMSQIDMKKIPRECKSGSYLTNYLNLGEVDHTALEDAIQTAKIYLNLLNTTSS